MVCEKDLIDQITRQQGANPSGPSPKSYQKQLQNWNRAKRDPAAIKAWNIDINFHLFVKNLKAECEDASCKRLIDTARDLDTEVTDPWDKELLAKQRPYLWKVFDNRIQAPRA